MPRVMLQDPWGMGYQIATRRPETLEAWFDEILPIVNYSLGQGDVPPAMIDVHPMWDGPEPHNPDWFADTRVIGMRYPFRAKNGAEGMAELAALRAHCAAELAGLNELERTKEGE